MGLHRAEGAERRPMLAKTPDAAYPMLPAKGLFAAAAGLLLLGAAAAGQFCTTKAVLGGHMYSGC